MSEADAKEFIAGPPKHAGCQNPDDDVRGPWCFTENFNCGYGRACNNCDDPPCDHCRQFQYCEEQCMPGTGIGGATRQGCPVQVYCRTADTIPRREKRWSPYELGQLPPFCGSVDAISYEDRDGAETELYGGHDVRENGIFAPFIYKMHHFAETGSGQT